MLDYAELTPEQMAAGRERRRKDLERSELSFQPCEGQWLWENNYNSSTMHQLARTLTYDVALRMIALQRGCALEP